MAQCPHGLGSFGVLGLRLIGYLTQVLGKSLVLWRLLDGSGGRSLFLLVVAFQMLINI